MQVNNQKNLRFIKYKEQSMQIKPEMKKYARIEILKFHYYQRHGNPELVQDIFLNP